MVTKWSLTGKQQLSPSKLALNAQHNIHSLHYAVVMAVAVEKSKGRYNSDLITEMHLHKYESDLELTHLD